MLCYPTLLANHFASRTEFAKREVAEAMRKAGIGDRGIDAVKATPDTPEEYAFILGREHVSAWLPKPHANAATLPLFQELCRKVQFLGDAHKPLLLKNPYDDENVPFLKDRFPSAKFLYLHRHPTKIVDSQLRAARSLFNVRNPSVAMLSPSYDRLFQCPKLLAFYRTVTSPRHGLGSRILVGGAIRRIRNATRQRRICRLPTALTFGTKIFAARRMSACTRSSHGSNSNRTAMTCRRKQHRENARCWVRSKDFRLDSRNGCRTITRSSDTRLCPATRRPAPAGAQPYWK